MSSGTSHRHFTRHSAVSRLIIRLKLHSSSSLFGIRTLLWFLVTVTQYVPHSPILGDLSPLALHEVSSMIHPLTHKRLNAQDIAFLAGARCTWVERRFINICIVGHCRSPLSMNHSEMLPRMRHCGYRLLVNCRSFAGSSTTPDCEVITPSASPLFPLIYDKLPKA